MKTTDRGHMYNLNEDDEELTHYGQSLSEIEKYEDPILSDDEDDKDKGKIGASIVSEEHFGGFLTKKKEVEGQKKSWKEKMEEIIATSKRAKFERQSEREETLMMTEKVDQEWRDMQFTLGINKRPPRDSVSSRKTDDFDVMVRTLQFEARGTATDRLKTEEEIAQEEKDKLDQLEGDRLRRMKGLEVTDSRAAGHKSADDLDDGFILDTDDAKAPLTYRDGKLVGTQSGSDDDDDDDDNEDDDNEDDEDEGEDVDEEENQGDGSEEEDEEEEESDEESDDDAMKHTSDLESDAEEEEVTTTPAQTKPTQVKDIRTILKQKKEVMEAARKELPYTFNAPESYEELLQTLEGHTVSDQLIIITRIRKCHHPSLALGNKAKLETLFTFLVQYYGDLAAQDPPQLTLLDRLVRPLYDMTQMSKVIAAQTLLEVIKEKQEELAQQLQEHGRASFPGLDVLMYLKLVSVLFPTSDFQHRVVTPAMLFMSQIITQSSIRTTRDVASGLFLCNLFLQYVSFSKRFVPEALTFLAGAVFTATKKNPKKLEPVLPPFKPVGKTIDLLKLQSPGGSTREVKLEPLKLTHIFSTEGAKYLSSDTFRVHGLWMSLKLTSKFSELYEKLPAYCDIFSPITRQIDRLELDGYPQEIKVLTDQIKEKISQVDDLPIKRLTLKKQKPVSFKQYEPQFDDVFDARKKSTTGKLGEKKKLQHKYKKELKSAVREIKNDTRFLAREKLKDTLERDNERKRKVKELFGDLATQEGEFKALKRKKDSMK